MKNDDKYILINKNMSMVLKVDFQEESVLVGGTNDPYLFSNYNTAKRVSKDKRWQIGYINGYYPMSYKKYRLKKYLDTI
jgi:hypothetical protein